MAMTRRTTLHIATETGTHGMPIRDAPRHIGGQTRRQTQALLNPALESAKTTGVPCRCHHQRSPNPPIAIPETIIRRRRLREVTKNHKHSPPVTAHTKTSAAPSTETPRAQPRISYSAQQQSYRNRPSPETFHRGQAMAKELTSIVAKPGHMGGGRAAGLVLPARVGVISDDPMALPPPSIKE